MGRRLGCSAILETRRSTITTLAGPRLVTRVGGGCRYRSAVGDALRLGRGDRHRLLDLDVLGEASKSLGYRLQYWQRPAR